MPVTVHTVHREEHAEAGGIGAAAGQFIWQEQGAVQGTPDMIVLCLFVDKDTADIHAMSIMRGG